MVSIFDVPKPIRLWFSSDEVANELDKMNGWLGIAKENATLIADLLAGLELKDVTIDAFNERLKNRLIPLVGEEKTRLAIQDVDEKILKPIKNDLIGFGIFPVETSYRPAAGSEAPVAVPSGTAAETPAPAEARPESSLKPAFETEPEPFLLHK
ncbi:MAG: hypothetical protein M1153_02590, partial [Patescibacteria group bacterium]|nr:hypothetical protein [Patescibacteria group bacterium]